MDKIGWLVNDCLTCIPGTKTFWHDLLDAIPGLVDKTYPDFGTLASHIENEASHGLPNYIIRNASYFRRLYLPVKQISLLQDIGPYREEQIKVCNAGAVTVFNSRYVADQYPEIINGITIPLGIDFDLFKPGSSHPDVLPDSILFVGSMDEATKGWSKVVNLIESTNYNFCLVMKDDCSYSHPRVRVFNRVNHEELVKIYNSCKVLICTSNVETQHLAGLEAAACNVPIVATNVGIYYNRPAGDWGETSTDFEASLDRVFNGSYLPREYFLKEGYDKKNCMLRWQQLIREL